MRVVNPGHFIHSTDGIGQQRLGSNKYFTSSGNGRATVLCFTICAEHGPTTDCQSPTIP